MIIRAHSAVRSPAAIAGTAASVVLFWIAAAILVAVGHRILGPRWPLASAAGTIGALLLAACLYMRVATRQAEVSHALGVGIAWLALTIVTEIVITTYFGQGWFALLGPPDRPLLRNLLLFEWAFAPALFAQREENP